MPPKMHFAARARRRVCWLVPALTSTGSWVITRLSVGPKSPFFSCRQSRQHGLSCSPEQWPVLLMSQAGPETGISQCQSGNFACVQPVFSDTWLYVFVQRTELLAC